MKITLNKIGKIFHADEISQNWQTHCMAPTGYLDPKSNEIQVLMGGWDKYNISRIFRVTFDANLENPVVKNSPVLNIGQKGAFDENGVFPGHINNIGKNKILSYTGFQLGYGIPHYNFGGLAIENGENFERLSLVPFLDRHDEGLFVRAGQSIIWCDKIKKYISVYSAGSSFEMVGGKLRPNYNIFLRLTNNLDKIEFSNDGKEIITYGEKEHGLGRPQIFKIKEYYVVIYTVRTKDMNYSIGLSYSSDLNKWERIYWDIDHYKEQQGFDSEMIYFPSYIPISEDRGFLIYSGNGFGKTGMGAFEIIFS